MASRPVWTVSLLLALLLPLEVLSQDSFDLADALDDSKPATPAPHPPIPAGGPELDFDDLSKVSTTTTTKAPPRVTPKIPTGTKTPAKPKPKPADDGFDLADALDPKNDIGGKDKNKGQGGGFSDSDLADVSKDDTYKPDKGKGTTAEVGTIAGIVSAVAMALVGAISSYISYQKKKLCFSLQRKTQS